MDAITDEQCPEFIRFRQLVSSEDLHTTTLLKLGYIALRKGVAKYVRPISVPLTSRTSATVFPRIEEQEWGMVDGVFRLPVDPSQNQKVASQGRNTCSLDVVAFMTMAFHLGRQRRDAQTLGCWKRASKTQVAFSFFMRYIACNNESVQVNNAIRDYVYKVIATEKRTIIYRGLNDLGEMEGYCWEGLRSLSYHHSELYTCCEDQPRYTSACRCQLRTSHPIELRKLKDGANPSRQERLEYPGKTVGDVVNLKYFHKYDKRTTHRTSLGDMVEPFAACVGYETTCKQLPLPLLRVLDDTSRYLSVAIDFGSPLEDDPIRQHFSDISTMFYSDPLKAKIIAKWGVVAVAYFLPNRLHFVARAYSPPGYPNFCNKFVEFDGQKGAVPYEVQSFRSQLDTSSRVTLLLYKLKKQKLYTRESTKA